MGKSSIMIRRVLLSRLAVGATRLWHPYLFDDICRFCMFIGHGRSGSTIVGALLNAHPNIVISNELNNFEYIRDDMTRDQLFNLIYFTARQQAKKGSRGGGGYSYAVPTQWQGRHKKISVIGNRKAGATAMRLFQDPELLQRLRNLVDVPVSFVSVVRNPFDTLTTTLRKTIRLPNESQDEHLKRQIRHYFERASAIACVSKEFGPDSVKFVHHDCLVGEPYAVLSDLCEYLGVAVREEYLADCASIIKPSVNVTRTQINWSPELIEMVNRGIADIPWLKRYGFSD